MESENKVEEFNAYKQCPLCEKLQKFKVVLNKKNEKQLSGRKCISCTSKKNNDKLKLRGYYKQYYLQHSDELKAADKLRYASKKANLVTFQ